MRETTTLNHKAPIHCAEFSIDGNYVMTGGADRSIKLWNPFTTTLIKTYTGHGKEVLSIHIPKDNTRFVSASGDRSVMIWDVQTGKPMQKFQDHTQRVNSVCGNPDGTVIISGSYDSTIKVWDCRSTSKRAVQSIDDAKDSVESVSINEYEILSSGVDGCIRNYDIRTGTFIQDDIGFPITSTILSNDKNCILVSTLDSVIRLLDKETGELLCDYKGHANKEYRIKPCFTKTDSHVIGGSEDGSILCWDLVEGNVVDTLKSHTKVVTGVLYHPSKDAFLSTSFDGTAKLWMK
jgi:mitogen-activated protein kinase organizer 1